MAYIYPQYILKPDKIYIALGSSIGDAEKIFESAEKYLDEHGLEIIQKSKNHKFPPYGDVAKNEFTNAVWEIEVPGLLSKVDLRKDQDTSRSTLSPFTYDQARKLLNLCNECEEIHGRTRKEKWADRTLDIDILTFGDLECDTAQLTIPHPEMQKRDFVMIPLREVLKD